MAAAATRGSVGRKIAKGLRYQPHRHRFAAAVPPPLKEIRTLTPPVHDASSRIHTPLLGAAAPPGVDVNPQPRALIWLGLAFLAGLLIQTKKVTVL